MKSSIESNSSASGQFGFFNSDQIMSIEQRKMMEEKQRELIIAEEEESKFEQDRYEVP
jgi:hypothetical protein